MKKVILANIGNRNLTYHGVTLLPDNRTTPPRTFRDQTKLILDDYQEISSELDEQILSVLLHDIGTNQIEKVVLFASDNQIEGDRNDQDTIHEAHILQRLFAERMGLVVEVVAYTQNVTHNDELLRFYRNILRAYQQSDSEVIICDAGGTAQQKSALKIAAEYLLDPDHFSVRYGLPSGKLAIVEQIEYRRIIDEEQVAALVEHGQYSGALTIYSQLSDSNETVLRLLNVLAKRSELFWTDAKQEVNDELSKLNPLLNALKNTIPLGALANGARLFDNHKMMMLCERLEIASFRYAQKDWTRAVMGFSTFIESFVNAIIHKQSRYKLEGNYFIEAARLLEDVKSAEEHESLRIFFHVDVRTGLPLHLKFAQKLSPGIISTILEEFEGVNSVTNGSGGKKGLDCLRNDVAHKARSIRDRVIA